MTTSCTSTTCRRSTGSMSPRRSRPIRTRRPTLAESLSSWNRNGKHEMRARARSASSRFVDGGQLGIFTNGYWGHPAMKLSPEVNLLAVAHYLQALEVQRKANKIVSILGSKTPHIQNLAVGGVANPIATDSQSVLTVERLMAIKGWIDELADFVKNVYLIDVAAVGAFYADWTKYGAGVTNYLSRAGYPAGHQGHAVRVARRLHRGRRSGQVQADQELQRRVLGQGRRGIGQALLVRLRARASRCIPTRARPSRTTPTSRTTASIPGSSRRPSTASRRRSGRWPACCACSPPATSRPRSTPRRRSTPCRRWPRPRSASTRCIPPSAAMPRARCRCAVHGRHAGRPVDGC